MRYLPVQTQLAELRHAVLAIGRALGSALPQTRDVIASLDALCDTAELELELIHPTEHQIRELAYALRQAHDAAVYDPWKQVAEVAIQRLSEPARVHPTPSNQPQAPQ